MNEKASITGLSEETIKSVLDKVEKMLRTPNVQVSMVRSVVRTTKPGDTYETYRLGKGETFQLEIPCAKDEYYQDPRPFAPAGKRRGEW